MSLLEQAIVDAQELKEAALKSAESAILEKYSADIKEAVDAMLEQEEDSLAMMAPEEEMMSTMPEEEIPYAADAELKLCACPDDDVVVSIEFDELQRLSDDLTSTEEGEQMAQDMLAVEFGAEEEEGEEIPMMEEVIDLEELLRIDEQEEVDLEDLEDLEDDLDMPPMPDMPDMSEALKIDLIDDTSEDNAGRPRKESEVLKSEDEAEKISNTKELPEEYQIRLSEAKKAIEARDAQIRNLKEKMQTLAKSSEKLKQTFMLMREQFEETNLSNAKLLYTNRTLKSTSLNERQKNRIVESIQSADTIEEAKVIFETLQSTVGESRKSTPKSLNEAISRPSMNVPRRRKVNSPGESLVKDRFQALAGIKK